MLQRATVRTSEDIITVRHKATRRVRNTITFLHERLKKVWQLEATNLPPAIEPQGLSAARKWYLFEKIWPYCGEEYTDPMSY